MAHGVSGGHPVHTSWIILSGYSRCSKRDYVGLFREALHHNANSSIPKYILDKIVVRDSGVRLPKGALEHALREINHDTPAKCICSEIYPKKDIILHKTFRDALQDMGKHVGRYTEKQSAIITATLELHGDKLELEFKLAHWSNGHILYSKNPYLISTATITLKGLFLA